MTPSNHTKSPAQPGLTASGRATLDRHVEIIEPQRWLKPIEQRFGIPMSTFDDFFLVQPNARKLFLVPRNLRPAANPPCLSLGMSFLHIRMKYPKLSTTAAMAFGPLARQNRVEFSPDQADLFLRRHSFSLPSQSCQTCDQTGYILGFIDEICLGIGLLRTAETGQNPAVSGGFLRSMIPQAWAMAEQNSAFDSVFASTEAARA